MEGESIEAKYANLSDAQLIRRIEQAPDFGYDDEAVELTRRLKLGRQAWRWSGDFFHPRVEVYSPTVILDRTAEEWHERLTTNSEGESTGHLATPGSRYGHNARECAWWAVAALSVYHAEAAELDDAEAFLEHVMGRVVNDDEELHAFIRQHEEQVPREVRDQLILKEEE